MGLLDTLLGRKPQTANPYYANLFQFLNSGNPVYLDDNQSTYVNEGYLNVGAVYECVDLIIKKIIACPVLVYEVKDQSKYEKYAALVKGGTLESKALALYLKAQSLEEVSPERIQKLLDQPNKLQTKKDFIRHLAGNYLLTGNAYIYKNGPDVKSQRWSELYSLPSQSMQIVSGGVFDPIKEYILNYSKTQDYPFPSEQIEHLKTFNPYFDNTGAHLYGVSPLRAQLRKLARAKAGDKEINKQLNNGGAFGLLSPKNAADILTPEQKASIKERMQEAKNAKGELDRMLPVSISMEWQQIGLPVGDMKLLDILQATDEDIYRAYHVPLQFRSTDSSTFNNQSVAGKQLIYNAVAPVADEIAEALTRAIADPESRRSNKKYLIKLDYTALPEMSEDMKEVAEYLERAYDLTLNEKREVKGYGRIDAENMDVPLVPKTLQRVDMLHLEGEGFSNALDKETNTNT